ncbi:flagellar hook-associated protein FlgL [Thiomicrospira sp. R3]|uniref:flagellar hook-associated protein FlgL n=1 Tax=Thiomicrospira sp. R3 TaxID=3035472 RepID=UPI00259B42C0|nr:flagellar hook-associated protein FlgL [Thiomicrospira sp. R3]WFE67923.1 flagellar hook-associated protein FlgL [Thiomicrospira sp. R3]
MRVSTNMIHSTSFDAIAKHQNDLLRIQEQLSTGKKVNRPSDDAVGITQIHKLTQTINTIDQYAKNGIYAKSQLVLEETAITNTVDVLQRVRELAVQMSTDTYNADQRKQTAAEVQQLMLHVKSIMNQKNSDGEHMFAGNNVNLLPFVDDPANPGFLTYIGNLAVADGGKPEANFGGRFVKIGFDVTNELKPDDQFNMSRVRITDAGSRVFGMDLDNPTASLGQIGINDANSTPPSQVPADATTIDGNIYNVMQVMYLRLMDGERPGDDILDSLKQSVTNMSENLAVIGGRQNRIEAQYDAGESFKMALTERRMNIEELDLVKGISDFTVKQNALQMAQQVFTRVQQMSLFDYLR